MSPYRFSGVSIDVETWQQVTVLVEGVGVTRTDLIRNAINELATGDGPSVPSCISQLEQDLVAAHARFAVTRAALLGDLRPPPKTARPSVEGGTADI